MLISQLPINASYQISLGSPASPVMFSLSGSSEFEKTIPFTYLTSEISCDPKFILAYPNIFGRDAAVCCILERVR